LVLKPILAAACLSAGLVAVLPPARAQQAPSGLSGAQISELVAGATVEVDTPAGTKLPVVYGRDGRISGEAGGLSWYLGAATDTGRWWVAADQLCHRWKTWFSGEPQCLRLSRQGRVYHWQSADGGTTGTARITAPGSLEAAPLLRHGRFARRAQPPTGPVARPESREGVHAPEPPAHAAVPGPAHAPAPQATAQATQPVPHPAREVSPALAQLPSLIVPPAAAHSAHAAPHVAHAAPAGPAVSAWPARMADHGTGQVPQAKAPELQARPAAAKARFKVANVRADDVLNVRAGPSSDHDIVGALPPGSRGIAITSECRSRWCPVQHDSTTGWVNSAYLAPEIVPVALNAAAPAHSGQGAARDAPEAPRACLTPAARGLLDRIERNFGPVEVVSTCRPGAFIANSARPSRHASGNAVDFKAGARKAAILEWLIANHTAGGIMTYAGMDHIHVDIGPRFVSLARRAHLSSWRRD
jgi:hypothetical protein